MTGDYRELIRRLQELVASAPSSELAPASASASAFTVPIFTSGPRILRDCLGSAIAEIIDNVHIGGQKPMPEQAKALARKWLYAEVSSNGC